MKFRHTSPVPGLNIHKQKQQFFVDTFGNIPKVMQLFWKVIIKLI